jgi:hypothetical protein
MGRHEKDEQINLLKQYLMNKHNQRIENAMPHANLNFKLPTLNKCGSSLEPHSSQRHLQNSNSTVEVNKTIILN